MRILALLLLTLVSAPSADRQIYSKENPLRVRLDLSSKDEGQLVAVYSDVRSSIRKLGDVAIVEESPDLCVEVMFVVYPQQRQSIIIASYAVHQPFDTNVLLFPSQSLLRYSTNFVNVLWQAVGVLPTAEPGRALAAWIDSDAFEKARTARQKHFDASSRLNFSELDFSEQARTNISPSKASK